jgi:hypothetical protein
MCPSFRPEKTSRSGDVHLYLEDPDSDRLVALYDMPSWSALPSTELMEEARQQRRENPETPASYLGAEIPPQERTWPEALAPDPADSEDLEMRTHRLRSIQLPPFSVERAADGSN